MAIHLGKKRTGVASDRTIQMDKTIRFLRIIFCFLSPEASFLLPPPIGVVYHCVCRHLFGVVIDCLPPPYESITVRSKWCLWGFFFQYITTVIPYHQGNGPPSNSTLQVLIKSEKRSCVALGELDG